MNIKLTALVFLITAKLVSGAEGNGSKKEAFDLAANRQVVDYAVVDKKPVALHQVAPKYPFAKRRAGIEGKVTVAFIVDENGVVRNAHAVKSSGSEFTESAVKAVNQWKFRAGLHNGKKVSTSMHVELGFRLNEES